MWNETKEGNGYKSSKQQKITCNRSSTSTEHSFTLNHSNNRFPDKHSHKLEWSFHDWLIASRNDSSCIYTKLIPRIYVFAARNLWRIPNLTFIVPRHESFCTLFPAALIERSNRYMSKIYYYYYHHQYNSLDPRIKSFYLTYGFRNLASYLDRNIVKKYYY